MQPQIATYTRQVMQGLAQIIADTGVAVYKTSGYAKSDIGVVFGAWNAAVPQSVKLANYMTIDNASTDAVQLWIQVATRWTPSYLAEMDTVDKIRDALHRRTHFDCGLVRVGESVRTSVADLGQDTATGYYEHTQNFRLTGFRWLQPVSNPN